MGSHAPPIGPGMVGICPNAWRAHGSEDCFRPLPESCILSPASRVRIEGVDRSPLFDGEALTSVIAPPPCGGEGGVSRSTAPRRRSRPAMPRGPWNEGGVSRSTAPRRRSRPAMPRGPWNEGGVSRSTAPRRRSRPAMPRGPWNEGGVSRSTAPRRRSRPAMPRGPWKELGRATQYRISFSPSQGLGNSG
jgi:hypothetical protein